MILVFGGTTEGRLAARVLDGAAKPYIYSTCGGAQNLCSPFAIQISGRLDEDGMTSLFRERGISLVIDAAHPFAERLHANVVLAAADAGIPVIRLERRYPPQDGRIEWCDGYEDAVRKIKRAGVTRLLALTGVQTIGRLRDYWTERDCTFRILDRDDSRSIVGREGFPSDKIIYYVPGGDDGVVLDSVRPDAVILKESGESGGFAAKTEAALSRGIKVFAVRRPVLPDGFVVVEGEITLRRAVERLMPGFFSLRSGLTTGTCATAAVVAALSALVGCEDNGMVCVTLPAGETVRVEVSVLETGADYAVASVVKDAGDDPDVTDGAVIIAKVALSPRSENDVRFYGGEGIGIVSLPGLGIAVGQPAINPVPRDMMCRAVREVLPEGGVDITISVPGGEELAERTFNGRVGVVGGISIIGTSGVVRPFSHEAFVEALTREIKVAVATGVERLVINSGAKSENAVRSLYPDLPPQAFVHYGNAVGETLMAAERLGIRHLSIGLMIGKAVKIAEGHLDTHSHKVAMNCGFLAGVAGQAGCSARAVDAVSRIDMARHLWTVLSDDDADMFFNELLSLCHSCCRSVFHDGSLEAVLIDDGGNIRYTFGI